jgi:hypothetical protein
MKRNGNVTEKAKAAAWAEFAQALHKLARVDGELQWTALPDGAYQIPEIRITVSLNDRGAAMPIKSQDASLPILAISTEGACVKLGERDARPLLATLQKAELQGLDVTNLQSEIRECESYQEKCNAFQKRMKRTVAKVLANKSLVNKQVFEWAKKRDINTEISDADVPF